MNRTIQFVKNTDPCTTHDTDALKMIDNDSCDGNKQCNNMNTNSTTISQNFDEWELDNLMDYIIHAHHRYAKENSVVIYNMVQKVAYKHCENHPELSKLSAASFLFLHDLLNQMTDEEKVLFPNIKQLLAAKRKSGMVVNTPLGFVKDSVRLMERQNKEAATVLNIFRELTNDYTLPADACNSYTYLFEKMKEFEDNLFLHIHLENNILFPKAIAVQEELDRTLSKKMQKKLSQNDAVRSTDFLKEYPNGKMISYVKKTN